MCSTLKLNKIFELQDMRLSILEYKIYLEDYNWSSVKYHLKPIRTRFIAVEAQK